MDSSQLNWIANFVWGIADVLRDLYVPGKYRDVILPMMALGRLDAVLEIEGLLGEIIGGSTALLAA